MLLLSKGSLDELPSVWRKSCLGHSNIAFVSMSSLKIELELLYLFICTKENVIVADI